MIQHQLCPFQKYRNIFGEPGKGAHSFRVLDVAIVDYVSTILLAFFLTYVTQIPVELTTIFSFILGIICHILFGVPTNTSQYLDMDCV